MTQSVIRGLTGTPPAVNVGVKCSYLMPGMALQGAITRNSANDATDDDEVVLCQFVIPPNIDGVAPGAIFELQAGMEYTNSGNGKLLIIRCNGASIGSVTQTTSNMLGIRFPIHVIDNDTLGVLNNAGTGAGGGIAGSNLVTVNAPNVRETGFTLALLSRWSAQPIASEFTRLRYAKMIFFPVN